MPTNDIVEEYLNTDTMSMNLVYEYSGINFNEQMELDCLTFKKLVKDAYIHKLSQSEEGRDYLEQCWVLTQTKPDRHKLKEKFKR